MNFRVVNDPRDWPVVVELHMVGHAGKHWDESPAAVMDRVATVCSDPDYITLNQSNVRKPRTGAEAYFRYFTDLNKIVMVPVQLTNETFVQNEQEYLGVRRALTCYSLENEPAVRKIWIRKV